MCDPGPSDVGRAEGGLVCVKQECKEVKLYWLYETLFYSYYISLFLVCINVGALYFMFYACPQLVSNDDCNLPEACGRGNADVKEECSLDFSNHFNNEGNTAVLWGNKVCSYSF